MRRIVRDLMTESIDVEVSGCELRAPLVYAVRVQVFVKMRTFLYRTPEATELLVRSVRDPAGRECTVAPTGEDNLALRVAIRDACMEKLGDAPGVYLAKLVWHHLGEVARAEVAEFIELETARKRKAADVTWKPKGIDQFYAQENGDFFEFIYETDDDVTYCRTLAELDPEEVDTLIEALTKFRDKHARKDIDP